MPWMAPHGTNSPAQQQAAKCLPCSPQVHLAADELLWLPVIYCGSGQGRAQEINWLWECYLFITIAFFFFKHPFRS